MRKYKTGIIIGRFQPFHLAHLEIARQALQNSDKLIIVVGSCNRPRTIKNPWFSEERIDMIRDAIFASGHAGWKDKEIEFPTGRIEFVEVRDYMYNNYKWAAEVYSKALAAGATDDKDTALYGCYKDDSSFYLNMFPQWDLNKVDYMFNLDATDIRNALYTGKISEWQPLLSEHIFWKLSTFIGSDEYKRQKDEYEFIVNNDKQFESYPNGKPTFVTVNALAIKSGHILMIKRGRNPGKGLWALPGGFLSQDEQLLDGAVRELKEKTHINIDKSVLKEKVADVQIFAHPKRSLRGRIITHAYLMDLGVGVLPTVKSDSAEDEVKWIAFADVAKMEREIFEDNQDIFTAMTSRF
jgi:bifunctional NMN adenylyltransferase/nudix hydrolase